MRSSTHDQKFIKEIKELSYQDFLLLHWTEIFGNSDLSMTSIFGILLTDYA